MHKLHLNTQRPLQNVLNKLRLYPVVIFVTWTLTTFYDNLSASPDYNSEFPGSDVFDFLVQFLPCIQGFLTGFVFLFTCPEIRSAWCVLLTTGNLSAAEKCLKTRGGSTREREHSSSVSLVTYKSVKVKTRDERIVPITENTAGEEAAAGDEIEASGIRSSFIQMTQTQTDDIAVSKFETSAI